MKSFIRLFVIISLVITNNAYAEYYLEYPEPQLDNMVYIDLRKPHKAKTVHHRAPVKHTYVKKQTHKRSTCQITVYNYYTCPPGACTVYPSRTRQHKFRDAYVHFDNKNVNLRGSYIPKQDPETFDQRTVDDDVMRDPNMNNQY